MLEETEKNNTAQEEFEEEQNLIGLFSILFEVAKRNPEKYFTNYQKKND